MVSLTVDRHRVGVTERSSHTSSGGDSGKWGALGETAAAPGAEEVGLQKAQGRFLRMLIAAR